MEISKAPYLLSCNRYCDKFNHSLIAAAFPARAVWFGLEIIDACFPRYSMDGINYCSSIDIDWSGKTHIDDSIH
jgi:hypothetical protein